jgi:hypothetical protein
MSRHERNIIRELKSEIKIRLEKIVINKREVREIYK